MTGPLPPTAEIAWLIAIALATGLVRGFTGGMGANFIMAPALAILVGPRQGIPMLILLNCITSVQLVPDAVRRTQWREVVPMGIAGIALAPLGIYFLFVVDEVAMKRAIAVTAFLFTLVLIWGWRYSGPRGPALSAGVGGLSGLINGAVGMGGPPIILYLLSSPETAAVSRANFIIFSLMLQTVSVAVFVAAGAYTGPMLLRCAIMALPFVATIWFGAWLFRRTSETLFRRFALALMLVVSVGALVA